MELTSCDADKLGVLMAKIDSLEDELGKSKAENLASDVERRNLKRKLEVKNEELKDLNWKLGFITEAEARADKRYKRELEYTEVLETEMAELRRRFQEERGKLVGKLRKKDVELGDLKEQLQISGNLNAASKTRINDVKNCAKSTRKAHNDVKYIEKSDTDDVCSDESDHEHEQEAEQTNFQITVECYGSWKITMMVELSWTIRYLKSKIKGLKGVPVNDIRLVFDAKQLSDNHTLDHYGIQKDSIIHFIFRLRG